MANHIMRGSSFIGRVSLISRLSSSSLAFSSSSSFSSLCSLNNINNNFSVRNKTIDLTNTLTTQQGKFSLFLIPSSSSSSLTTASPSQTRMFHQSQGTQQQKKMIQMKLDRYVGETGHVVEPEIPNLSLSTMDGWKAFFLTPRRMLRNWYSSKKIREDGVGMKKFSLREFRELASSHFVRYNQAYVKHDLKELKDISCDKMYTKAKNDEKIGLAKKKYNLQWVGSVNSVLIYSVAYVPIEEIKTTFVQIKVQISSKQQLKILDKKTGEQVAGQQEGKEKEEWWIFERPITKEFSHWKILAKLPVDQ